MLLVLVRKGCSRITDGRRNIATIAPNRLNSSHWPKPGPSLAQARFLGTWKSGDLEIWEFGIQNFPKIKIIEIKIRYAQNVGKVWISRKKILLAPFGAISDNFFH